MIALLHPLGLQVGGNFTRLFIHLLPGILTQLTATQGLNKRHRIAVLRTTLSQRL